MTIRGNFLTQKGGLSEEAAEKNWNGLMPWKDINQVFTTFGLKIQLELNNLGSSIRFLKNNSLPAYYSSDLSSGEKVAYCLALWQYGSSVNKKSKVFTY